MRLLLLVSKETACHCNLVHRQSKEAPNLRFTLKWYTYVCKFCTLGRRNTCPCPFPPPVYLFAVLGRGLSGESEKIHPLSQTLHFVGVYVYLFFVLFDQGRETEREKKFDWPWLNRDVERKLRKHKFQTLHYMVHLSGIGVVLNWENM